MTTHDDESGVGVMAMHAANDLPTFRIAFAGDRTCVDDTQVRLLGIIGFRVADTDQTFTNVLRFVLINLATKRVGFQFCGHSPGSGSMVADIEPEQRSIR